ncbi:MAG: LysR family transcriptional regulator [Novosphingobium sp.]|nr:LysR family transcriptional regulator [Novosphingobium sp.]
MDIETLRIFADVAHRGSFSEVARARGTEPSSISRAVGVLEAELGERLFHRTTRKLVLTEAGALYLVRIEPLVAQLEEAGAEARAIGRGPVGTLRLAVSVSYGLVCLMPVLERFRALYPELTVELLMNDAQVDLVREGIDLAVRLTPAVEGNLVATRLAATHYRVVAAPGWLAAHPMAAPGDLAAMDVLRFTLPGFRDRWMFRDAAGREEVVPVSGRLLISNAAALREAALMGMGPALLADWMIARDLAAGELVDCFPTLEVAATGFDTGVWAIYPSRSFLPGKVRAMLDFLRAELPKPAI